jgi:NTE family protein
MFNFFDNDDDESGPEFEFRAPKIGLALGAGVARGWAHIGVLKAMEAHGIKPDVIAGTSIGAVVGGAWAYGPNGFEAIEAWARSLAKINFFRFLDFKFLGGGLFGGKKLHDLMSTSFGDRNIEALDIPFVAIATELMTGHEIWLDNGDLIDALEASFALPGVFEPVHFDSRWLVDGALVNPVPVSVCRALGAELVIAVNLSDDIYGRARAERKGVMSTGKYGVFSDVLKSSPTIDVDAPKSAMRQLLGHKKGAPSLFANMVASLNIVQNRLSRSRLAGDPPDIMISPQCGHVGLMEFHRADELIELGKEAFEHERDALLDAYQVIGYRRTLKFGE